jgi:hypothetical protein
MTDITALANQASELLNNEAFVEAVRRVDTNITETWRQTGPRERDERESLYYQQQALAAIVGQLTDMRDEPSLYPEEKLDETETEDQ